MRKLLLLIIFLLPSVSFANDEIQADRLIQKAYAFETAGNWAAAAYLYQRVASLSPTYRGLATFKADRARLAAGNRPVLQEVPPYPGRDLMRLQAAGVEPGDELKALLESGPDAELICAWMGTLQLTKAANLDLYYAHCTDAELSNWPYQHTPSAQARLMRAHRMHGQVRFNAANAEIEAIDASKLSAEEHCDMEFRKGRTVYRLRRRDDAEAAYRWVRDNCSAYPGVHIRALYAIGKRRFEKSDLDASEAAFKALVETYPDRSHADDGWFYLARVARERKDRKAELAALEKILKNYRDGDMLFETVWEVHESIYRADDFKGFVKAIEALDLPDHDNRYYSQGRLEYFLAAALTKMKQPDRAETYLQRAWKMYPFSFYGYLARIRMLETGLTPAPIEVSPDAPNWKSDGSLNQTASARLLRLGLPELAADASVELGDSDGEKWWKAMAHHMAGRYHVSHNIVRRQIPGRPWHQPSETSLVVMTDQWELAWPNPFGDRVKKAVDAEAAQFGTKAVDAALPTAIMREESSFIEDVESYAGALGLMQLMPRTALAHDDDVSGAATPERLKTAEVNVRVGVDHIYWLAKRFDGHPVLMVAAYNAGSGAVGKWLKRQPNDEIALFVEDIPYLQTRDYTKRVIGSYAAYQWMNGNHQDWDRRVVLPAKK